MARQKFTIKNELHSDIAAAWIVSHKLNNPDFDSLKYYQHEEINIWCEKHLDKRQWTQLKGAIRSKKLRQDKKIHRVDLNTKAYKILKELANSYGVTLSKLIVNKLENEWIAISEPEEIEAAETMAAQSKPEQAPANSPIIATDNITLPVSIAEYDKLVSRLKLTDIWQKKNGQEQNMVRIFKASGVLLPNGKMTKPGLTEYLKTLS